MSDKKKTLSLNGIWKLKGTMAHETPLEFNAQIPSHVHQTLFDNGIIPDHNFQFNAKKCQWIEHWNWQYQKSFTIEKLTETKNYLVFEGLDTYAEIILNGKKLAKTSNMFVEHRFDVNGLLQEGGNTLTIAFKPIKEDIKDFPLDQYGSIFTYDRVFTRRMQCTYSWDWVHRFISYGIFRNVYIESYCASKIDNVYVATRSLSADSAQLFIKTQTENDPEVILRSSIFNPDGALEFFEESKVNQEYYEVSPSIEFPQLWWPATHGEQPLYTLKIQLFDNNKTLLDEITQKFGIRTIVIEQIMDKPGSKNDVFSKKIRENFPQSEKDNQGTPGKSFTILVNGRKVFLRGANWVPLSPFPAENHRDRYNRFVELAVNANINVLRVWGGGMYAPDELLEACDEMGVLIAQDFLMACGEFPIDQEAFESNLNYEFPLAIKRLRNHASLAWYNGDNELGMNGDFDDPNYNGRAIFEKVTRPSVKLHDPYRDYIPTSPFGGRPNSSLTIGNSHYTCFLMDEINRIRYTDLSDYRQYFTNQLSRFVSEAMSFGAPSIPSLKMFMGENLDDKSLWDFHTKNHPFLTDYSLYDALAMMSEKVFGESSSTIERILKIGYIQYEWVRLLVENHRRHQWYNSGIIFWMYNDIWAASGWALVDYYGYPKAGYYGMKKAASPLLVSIEEITTGWDIYVVNGTSENHRGMLNLFLEPFSKTGSRISLAQVSLEAPPNEVTCIYSLKKSTVSERFNNSNILIAEISGSFGTKQTFCPYDMPKEMQLEKANLKIERSGVEQGILEISTDHYARIVCLEGDFDFEDNYFDILPNSTVKIQYKPSKGAIDRKTGNSIHCYALNTLPEKE